VLRGWQLSPLGPRALLDLARAPFFVLWKLYIVLRNRGNKQWIKTNRDTGKDPGRAQGRSPDQSRGQDQ